jgi:hypothetical protein
MPKFYEYYFFQKNFNTRGKRILRNIPRISICRTLLFQKKKLFCRWVPTQGILKFELPKGLFTIVTKGRDQSSSCIVIGGKVGAGPSSLYTIKSDQGL